MADRKAELEKKRKKLEELKKAREQNKLQAKDKEVDSYCTNTEADHEHSQGPNKHNVFYRWSMYLQVNQIIWQEREKMSIDWLLTCLAALQSHQPLPPRPSSSQYHSTTRPQRPRPLKQP